MLMAAMEAELLAAGATREPPTQWALPDHIENLLDHLGEDKSLAVHLLSTLAIADTPMTIEEWTKKAEAAWRDIGSTDRPRLLRILNRVAPLFRVSDEDGGPIRYRLYHTAIRDYFRQRPEGAERQGR
jgi:hypothetical protein